MSQNIVASSQITLVDINDAKSLTSYISSNQPKVQIFDPNTNTHLPNWATSNVVLTPELYVSGTSDNIITQAKSVTWFEGSTPIVSGTGGYSIGSTGAKALTVSQNKLSDAKTSILYVCEIVWTDLVINSDIVVKVEIEFSRVKNGLIGTDAIIGVLSNETHAIPTDSAGNNPNFGGANTTLTIYQGSTDVTSSWSISQAVSGVTVTASGSPANRTATITGISADIGSVTFTATRSGFATITKTFNVSRNKGGVAGTTPTTYWLVPGVSALQKSISNVFTPSNITVSAKSQTGTGAPQAYSGRFRISDSTDGTTFTARYTSGSNQASYTYPATGSFASNIKALKIEMFLAGGTTTLLDEQIIPVVADGNTGAPGENSVMSIVWTPDGNIVKNASGSVIAQCDVYNGTTLVTATYQWYKQDSTVVSDQGGGVGWLRLASGTTGGGTTGWTSKNLTIPASAVTSMTSFKCIASHGGKSYADVVTIVDQSDPIQITLIAAEGNTFRNGQGTKSVTAKVYRAGEELDTGATVYEYRWFLRDADGVLSTTFVDAGKNYKTGKTVTVPSSAIFGIGNLVMELWTR